MDGTPQFEQCFLRRPLPSLALSLALRMMAGDDDTRGVGKVRARSIGRWQPVRGKRRGEEPLFIVYTGGSITWLVLLGE